MKCTRQRCHVAPTTRWTAASSPSCASEITSLTQAASGQALQEVRPEGLGFRRANAEPDDLAPSFGVGSHSDYRGDRDDASALAHLQVGRIQPQIGPLAIEGTFEERLHALVDVLAQFRDLALRDTGKPHRLRDPIDPAREHAANPGLLDDGDKIGRGKERQVNARFSAMVSHFLFEADFCNPASGWEKGQIEKNVQDARHRLWQPMPSFPSLAALNDWLEMRCRELWEQTRHGSHPGAIADAWAEEVQRLMQLPRPFDGFVEHAKRVSPTCLVHMDRNRYSVPASFANRPVSLRVYPDRIVVAAEGQIVCEHRRVFARSHQQKSTTTVYDWRHYLAVIQRKPGALRNGAPFVELPPAFRALQQRMLKTPGGDREMVEACPRT